MFGIYGGTFFALSVFVPEDTEASESVLDRMLGTRSLLKTVSGVFFIATVSHAVLLSESLNVSIQSENMNHILKWNSLQKADCSASYTVQYQGEFESKQNNTWLDAHSCIDISKTECDLSLVLASDCDYNISVLARCGDYTVWTRLPKTFNRRDTVLLPPKMDVSLKAGQIEVYFHDRQKHINITLSVWKKGAEHDVSDHKISDRWFRHNVSHDAGEYCVRATAVLELQNKKINNSTDDRCVRESDFPSWLVAVAAGVAVTFTLVLAVTLGLLTPRCSHWIRKSARKKEELPSALLDWSTNPPLFSYKITDEVTHSIFLLNQEVAMRNDETSPRG